MLKRMPPPTLNSRQAIALYAQLATFTARDDSLRLDSIKDVQAFALRVVVQADSDEAKAFELLKDHIQHTQHYSTLALAELDAVAHRFCAHTPLRLARMGAPTGSVEFVGKKQLGETLVRVSYLQHRTRFPMLWLFDFYRTAGGWTLTAFSTDSDAADLLKP
jgi:hypothetical protein